MGTGVQQALEVAQKLTPKEQRQLIQAISRSLDIRGQQQEGDAIPSDITRSPPASDLGELAADFWPVDESADDVNDYVSQQRREDRWR